MTAGDETPNWQVCMWAVHSLACFDHFLAVNDAPPPYFYLAPARCSRQTRPDLSGCKKRPKVRGEGGPRRSKSIEKAGEPFTRLASAEGPPCPALASPVMEEASTPWKAREA